MILNEHTNSIYSDQCQYYVFKKFVLSDRDYEAAQACFVVEDVEGIRVIYLYLFCVEDCLFAIELIIVLIVYKFHISSLLICRQVFQMLRILLLIFFLKLLVLPESNILSQMKLPVRVFICG